jgi:hypothetical protein
MIDAKPYFAGENPNNVFRELSDIAIPIRLLFVSFQSSALPEISHLKLPGTIPR